MNRVNRRKQDSRCDVANLKVIVPPVNLDDLAESTRLIRRWTMLALDAHNDGKPNVHILEQIVIESTRAAELAQQLREERDHAR
jgi:hypothetical protein